MRIAICIATFHRLELLRELLSGISRLTFRRNPVPEIRIIVVDNDPLGSAAGVCRSAELRFPVHYRVEPLRGIAHARNRAIREAGDADFLAFIDDDEVPSPEWLDELLWCHSEHRAEIVAGPVRPEFTPGVPRWIREGAFFDRPEFPTGTLLEKCATNNVLVSSVVLRSVPRFDERFQLTGAEDTHFFLCARSAGFRMVWSAEALVSEAVSTDRANARWILQRGFQGGNSWVLCELSFDSRAKVRLGRFLKALVRVVTGLLAAAAGLFLGRAALVRGFRKACLGAGMISGLFGQKYLAYQDAGSPPAAPAGPLGARTRA